MARTTNSATPGNDDTVEIGDMDVVGAGRTLRAIRESHRLSQEDVRDRTGIQISRLSLIERGMIDKPPSLRDGARLAKLYGLSPRSMFEIYGLPVAQMRATDAGMSDPPEVVALRAALDEIGDEATKAEILGMVRWVVDMANAKIAAFAHEDNAKPAQRRVVRAKG